MTESKRFIYKFGKFTLDPQEKTLFSDGVPVHLPAKEFETLLLLVENNGRALSKQEIMAVVWQDAFVEEGNLAKQISRLRKILNTNGQQYISTLPKYGYRFSAEMRLASSETELPLVLEKRTVKRMKIAFQENEDEDEKKLLPSIQEENPPRSGRHYGSFLIVPLALILLLTLIGVWLYFRNSETSKSPENISAIKSIAVLPFRSVKAGDDEYFRLGLTDALTTKLSNLKQIVVRPTNAVRRYEAHDPLTAGRELGVDAVLDGNVQQVGQQIRVTAQLVNVRDGGLLWSGKFDEQFTDIFSIQDSISEQVAQALAPELTGAEKTLVTKRYTTNADAHYAYVRGRIFSNKRTPEDLETAIKYFSDAIEKDPKYALAYSGLADSYSLLSDYGGALPDEAYPKARDAAMKALALDDELAEAHTSLAYVKMYYFWDWQQAEAEYRRAISLNPNYASAHQWYSEYLTAMGRFDEALAEVRRAKEIDPLSTSINTSEVWTLYFARRYDEAIARGREIAEMNPQFPEIREYLKRCYDQKAMFREAIAERQIRRKISGLDDTLTPALKDAAAATSPKIYWQKRLEQEITEAQSESPEMFNMAEIYAQLDEKDLAFEWLEKALKNRHYELMYLKVAPNLDPLRSDPRFDELLKRIELNR